jgi:glycosyltransferase involved in cell wall biosynthesis
MKIAHISKSDRKGGGASKVAEYLTINQKSLGHHVDHFTAQDTEGANSVYKGKKYLTHLRSKLTHYGYLDCFDIESFLFKKIVKEYNILHFHDITHSFSPACLANLSHKAHVIWTLHDMSPVTAGCIQPFSCNRYKMGCKECPQSGKHKWPMSFKEKYDRTGYVQNKRLKDINNSNIKLVSPSRWLRDIAKNHISRDIAVIPNGATACDDIKENDVNQLRKELGFANDKLVILFSSGYIHSLYKGGIHILQIVKWFANHYPNVSFLFVGASNAIGDHIIDGLHCHFTGSVYDDTQIRKLFCVADLMIMLSSLDNLPLTILEGMQADLAIYAYDVGGVKECVIFDDVSVGRVFKYGVIDELCVAIVEDINSGNLHTFRSNAKRKKKEFTWNIVASNYLDYYEKII